jgi:energy-coupling factor transport system ATP-binding protein
MAALCAATAIIAVVVPFAGGLALLGTVPMGLLAYCSPRRWPPGSSHF